ncbi:hypothetical protein [Marinactinospora rubrisoli]|uniref:Uncharacterized protein n=1 Tax=Marinactinospora rubrisoli TaxID=2715399 RepID=A0ABW2KNA5_9ACTN
MTGEPVVVEVIASNGREIALGGAPVPSWGIDDGAGAFWCSVEYRDGDGIEDAVARFQAAGLLPPGRAEVLGTQDIEEFWIHEDHPCYTVRIIPAGARQR